MSQDGGSHYFIWQSSDNSKMRWHDLLMRNMQILILCTTFVMEMLELRGDNSTHVFATVHPEHGGRCRHNVHDPAHANHRLALLGSHM
jgi:hypothetical protein